MNVGDVIDKHRVERVIGGGAMGLVVAARHTTLDQVVAIKFLIGDRFSSPEVSKARFLREARACAQIDSDHVCRVFDVDTLPSGVPYMIMEYLEGNDLEEEIRARGQLDVTESVDYILQALDAMAAAHLLGVVHRDLKPANLFLARRADGSRRVKVLDFGISKAETTGMERLTLNTRSIGTPAYMPPEQIREPMTVDHRADIWALGAILYELLTGQMAFRGETVSDILDRVVRGSPTPIESVRRDVPLELVDLIARALMRDRDERWPTVALFARALAPYGTIGVTSGLTNISREVGSLTYSSMPSISVTRIVASSRAMPHAMPDRPRVPTIPDGEAHGERAAVVVSPAPLPTRRGLARRAIVVAIASALLLFVLFALYRTIGSHDATSRPPGAAAPSHE